MGSRIAWGMVLAGTLAAACERGQRDEQSAAVCTGARLEGEPRLTFGGDRPVEIQLPQDYDPTCPTPLLLILHGYGASGLLQTMFFDATDLAREQGLIIAAPDGTLDSQGKRFWNAGDACCDFFDRDVDDVGYLGGLVDEIAAEYNVDPDRIYVLGHSNGGFMAYELACRLGDRIAAVASLAGASATSLADCTAARTSVLQMHGTADDIVRYPGGDDLLGDGGPAYPGAVASTALWAAHDGCADTRSELEVFDLDTTVAGAETRREAYDGCPAGVSVELWSIEGGGHVPIFGAGARDRLWQWFVALRRPG